MQNCDKIQELISCLLDGELSSEERADVAKHLESCEECRNIYESFAAVSECLREEAAEAPDSIRENVMAELRREALEKRNIAAAPGGGRSRSVWKNVLGLAAVAALALGLRYAYLSTGVREAAVTAPLTVSMQGAELAKASETAEDPAEAAETEEAAAPEAPLLLADSSAAGMSPAASADIPIQASTSAEPEIPRADLSGTLTMSGLLEYLAGEKSDAVPDPAGPAPVLVVTVSDGELVLFERDGALCYIDPGDSSPYLSARSVGELLELAVK